MARVLICEDDPAVAGLLSLTFSLDRHLTEIIADGDDAIARIHGEVADLLILDVMLPGRDGIDVLRHVRANPRWERCRVIVLTALDDDESMWRGWSSGADYYLTKPFRGEHLREIAARLLAGEPLDADLDQR